MGTIVRVAWHLGNRHLPTEMAKRALRIRRDHVIEDMARGLGAEIIEIEAPFNPEGGAYVSAGHDHGHHDHHDHSHSHAGGGHDHAHANDHDHSYHDHSHAHHHDRVKD